MPHYLGKYLILLIWFNCYNCERSKIESKDGDLILQSELNKKVYFKTSGPDSAIFLNDINVLYLNKKNAVIYEEEPKDRQLALNGVINRLQSLESANLHRSSNNYVDEHYLQQNLNDINDRLVGLERKVTTKHLGTCSLQPCLNGGTCLDLSSRRHCICPNNWKGDDCGEDVDECLNLAGTDLGCQNKAMCVNKQGSYECVCKPGWYGVHCTKRANDCSGSNFETCGHGTCIPVTNDKGIKCICEQGWTTDDTGKCLKDVDECNTKLGARCSKNPKVDCVNLPGSFWCGPCPEGYEGDGYVCSDIDECLTIPNGGCSISPKVLCHNIIGSRICGPCPHGYEGDGVVCTWKGACNINNGNCYPTALCIDNPTVGNTQCICPDGMEGNGVGANGCHILDKSNRILNCDNNPCGIHGKCLLLRSGYTCVCSIGYTGLHCESQQNYCNSSLCVNGGTCVVDSRNARGFRCECSSQFSGEFCQIQVNSCGGLLDAEAGTLTFPNSNHSYSHNSQCAWILRTVLDKVINITFTKLNLAKDKECIYDFLQIHDGRNPAGQLIGRFCGNVLPRGGNIISSHNYLYFWFHSDRIVAKEGFSFYWKSIKPVCGGDIYVTTFGQISSPGSPGNYPPNRDCFWVVQTAIGKRIDISFFSLDIEVHYNCSYDYVSIYDGRHEYDPLLSKLCNSSLPAPLKSAGSIVLIHFHSDSFGSGKGFQLTYAPTEGIPGCGGYYTDDRSEISAPSYQGPLYFTICEYKIRTTINSVIRITFTSLQLRDSSPCLSNYLKIYDGPSSDSKLIGSYCGYETPPPIISSSNNLYIIYYSYTPSMGFRIKYEALCQQTLIGDSGIIISPGYPFGYPRYQVCNYLIATDPGKSIQLTFQDFYMNGDWMTYNCSLSINKLQIRDGPTENSTLMGTFCGNFIPATQISTHNYMHIKFISHGFRTSHNSTFGFYANYTIINRACGGIYKNDRGLIMYPTNYLPNINNYTCLWVVQAPQSMFIKLTVNRFSLGNVSSSACYSEYLELFEVDYNNNNNSLGRFCGKNRPPSLTTSTNELIFKYQADRITTEDGFSFSYTFLEDRSDCNSTYINTHGLIKYPLRYRFEIQHCTWIIKVPKGQQIRLNVSHFDTYKPVSGSCSFGNYLVIRNGASETSPIYRKFCGYFKYKIITSAANSLYIKFRGITPQPHPFWIEWDSTVTGCGGTLTSASGSISSPNYPNEYDSNEECFYKVTVKPGSRIKFSFIDLELEESYNCKLDYVEIFDGRDENSLSLGKFCTISAINSQNNIISSLNFAFIKYRTHLFNDSISRRGFLLFYDSICNNTLTGLYGVIESPDKDSLTCLWTITVPKGNRINVTFTYFDINSGYNNYRSDELVPKSCTNYLQVKEKAQLNFTKKYCGSTLPAAITSKTESLQFYLFSKPLFIYDSMAGFRLEWVRYGCGGHIKKEYGYLNSKNEIISPDKEFECEWIIETAIDASIIINFSKIYITDSPNCTVDAIAVYNGVNDKYPLISKFCHSGTTVLSSTSNTMLIRFIKHSLLKNAYFMSHFTSPIAVCGGVMQSLTGTIQSIHYPKNYEDNLNCVWKITVTPNHKIELNFEDLDLFSTVDGPCNDSIRVYDDKKVWPIICGGSNVTLITSRNNILNIQFMSDNFGNAKGFKAKFSITCGGMITARSEAILRSQNFVNHNNKSCVWTILAPNTYEKIALTITYMSITNNHNNIVTNKKCPVAFLKIYDGIDVDGPLVDEFCGKRTPPLIVSQGSALTLELGTYVSDLPKGKFIAHYTNMDNACGGELFSEEGYVASPKFPLSYPVNVDCEWTLNTSPGNQVYILFETFDLENSVNCNEDYLEIRENDGAGNIIGIYCGNKIPENTTIANKLFLKFHSSGKVPGAGFLLRYGFLHGSEIFISENGQIASPMYPYKFEGVGEFSWRLKTHNKITIDIYIDKLEIPSFDSYCNSFLTFFDGYDDEAPIIDTVCGVVTRNSKSLKSSSNVIFIKFAGDETNRGSLFILTYSKSSPINKMSEVNEINCGKNETINLQPEQNFIFTSPKYPADYDNNLNCQWIFSSLQGQHLNLHFIDIMLQQVPLCYADYVTVYTAYHDDPTQWKQVGQKLCLSENVQNDINIAGVSYMKVMFKTDSSTVTKGFKAQVTSQCGGYITKPSGVFGTSWSYSTDITTTNSVTCEWIVKVRPGRTIKLYFQHFELSNNTCDTFVVLKNGDSIDAPLLGPGKYCGYSHENRDGLKTSSNALFVKYRTMETFKKFMIRYEEENIECGGTSSLNDEYTWETIKSPNYPSVPPPYTECVWVFTAPPGELLRVDFINRFDIEDDHDCSYEAVEIRDGPSTFFPIIGRYCGKKPGTIKTSNNQVYIKYLTKLQEPRDGFSANISIEVCGGIIQVNEGGITSPGYPASKVFPPGTVCEWHIIAENQYTLVITPQLIKLPKSELCDSKVTIEENTPGNENAITTLKTFCYADNGNYSRADVISSFNKVTLKYYYGNKIHVLDSNYRGFRFYFKSKTTRCGGVITTPEGIITTPGYPNEVRVYICSWVIIVPNKSRRVRLKIIDLNEQKHSLRFFKGSVEIKPVVNEIIESSCNKLALSIFSEAKPHRLKEAGPHRLKAKFDSDEPALCGGEFHNSSGKLDSPEISGSYYCDWDLRINSREDDRFSYASTTIFVTATFNITKTSNDCHLSKTRLDIDAKFDTDHFLRYLCGQNTVSFRIPFSNINFFATKFNNSFPSHFQLNWVLKPCGGIIHAGEEPVNVFYNIPKFYNESLECAWIIITKMKRVTIKLEGEFVFNCDNEFILIDTDLYYTPTIANYCKDKTQAKPLTVLSSIIYIQYHSKPYNNTKVKLIANVKVPQCGGYLSKYDLYFTSPNYPNNYIDNQECTWEIEADVGFRISLKFIERFAIELQPNCTKDAIIIYDWKEDSWVEISRLCGRVLPPAFNSTDNKMKVTFRTDNSTNLDGFKATWMSICGGLYTATKNEQILYSLSKLDNRFRNLNCTYNFVTEDATQKIEFKLYDDLYSICEVITNVTLVSGNKFKAFLCDSPFKKTYILKNTTLIVQTKGHLNFKSFKFSYRIYNCGGYVTKPTELIGKSLENNNCTWFIEAPPTQVVIVKFININIHKTYICYDSHISAYSGLQIDPNNRLAILCGYLNSSTTIKSPNNTMTLNFETIFKTYDFKVRVMFSYSESVGCGGLIMLPSSSTHIVKSPLFNGSGVYENYLHCQWKVHAPVDQIISVEFNSFHIALCKDVNQTTVDKRCVCDSVEIRDGLNPTSYRIGVYCGHQLPRNVTTSSNTLLIELSTDGEITSSGFELKLTSRSSLCGQSRIEVSKTVQQIKFPGNEANNNIPSGIHCLYHLVFKDKYFNRPIHLKIKEINLRPGFPDPSICNKDKLTIALYNDDQNYKNNLIIDEDKDEYLLSNSYLGYGHVSNIPERFEYCGEKKSIDLYLYRSATVSLQTDPQPDPHGHKFVNIEVKQVEHCAENRTDLQGRISVNKPRGFVRNLTSCAILISAPSNHTISIYFLHIAPSYVGSKLNIDIFDGNSTKSDRLVTIFQDYDKNLPIFSTSNHILMFGNVVQNEILDFDLNYLTTDKGRGCGESSNGLIGKISSPRYPEVYRHKGSCEWQLETPYKTRLRLHFLIFDLGINCDQNYLQILNRNGVVISSFCSEIPADYTMEDNYAKIVFITTRNNGGTGWVLEYVGVA